MKQVLSLFLLLIGYITLGQSTDILLNHPAYDVLDKWQTKSNDQFFTSFKPYGYRNIPSVLNGKFSPTEDFNRDYTLIEGWEYTGDSLGQSQKPFLKHFYKYKNDFYAYKDEDFDVHINPIWHLWFGNDNQLDKVLFTNSRGLQLRGNIDNRVAFFSQFTENQVEFPAYVKTITDSLGVIPYQGFWKEYNESTTDFFEVLGYVDVRLTKHISSQLGYGKHFIGNGKRSLFLSDVGNSYPYLRNDVEVWKLKYSNLFAKLTADVDVYDGGNLGASDYPNKYMNTHHFDFSILPNLHIGIFESVIYGKPDSLGGSNAKLEYFVPFIFLRGVEQQDGSGDNSLLGIEAKWNVWKRWQLYGQFILDDFSVSEAQSGDSWWGNKYGVQLGTKVFDIFSNLDWQAEFNSARPFLYAHQDIFTSYSHYRQALAHPLGANFREVMTEFRYQPIGRLHTAATLLLAEYGNDIGDLSYGRDPLKSYIDRNADYGIEIGQGDHATLIVGQFIATYQLKHNFFIDLSYTFRNEDVESLSQPNKSSIVNAGFRWNSFLKKYHF